MINEIFETKRDVIITLILFIGLYLMLGTTGIGLGLVIIALAMILNERNR